jgi:hypothetical protein
MADPFLARAPRGTHAPLLTATSCPRVATFVDVENPSPPPSVSLSLAPSPSPLFARHG